MLQNYNKWKVLKVFFSDPDPKAEFQLREISRAAKIAPPSVKKYLGELKKEGLITETKHRANNYPLYSAKRESTEFRFLKKTDMIFAIRESGLLDYLDEECAPDAIVLFGSASRGEDIKESDIDLFLLCKETKLDLSKYEKNIKRKINILFEEEFGALSKELKNNIINGAILKGYLKVFN